MRDDDVSSVTQSLSFCEEDDRGDLGAAWGEFAPTLYDRGTEQKQLVDAYHQVVDTGDSRVVFVHGASGLGKTSLVDTLREPVCALKGHFCAGKFFQDSSMQEPYSALMSAFSDLCDVVVQSENFDDSRRSRIREGLRGLGGDNLLLSSVINLAPFLGESEGVVEESSSTFAQFKAECKMFLQVICATEEQPLVLFIDDIQWMDEGSRLLLDMFVSSQDFDNILFAFSYRDEEEMKVRELVASAHNNAQKKVVDIQLKNLGVAGVHLMVCKYLGSSSSEVYELSEFLCQRTHGNPLALSSLLLDMKRGQLLTEAGSGCGFNMNDIRSAIMVSDDVAQLLARRIQSLSVEVRVLLVAASLIGYAFDESILERMPSLLNMKNKSDSNKKAPATAVEKVRLYLQQAVGAGLIEKMKVGYQFTHDRLQEAFQNSINERETERLHLQIGQVYLAQSKNETMMYNGALHLNRALSFLQDDKQRVNLAHVNLRAARYCRKKSAFAKAVTLLRRGLSLCNSEQKWSSEHCDLTFEMTELLAKMLLFVGDLSSCQKAVDEAKLHAHSKERIASLLLIGVECRMANNEMEESVDEALSAVSELGVKVPRNISTRHVVFMMMKLKIMMARKSDDDILQLPPIQDQTLTVVVRLLGHVSLYALLMDDEPTSVYAALVAWEMSMKHGLSSFSSTALALFACGILQMGNVNRAYCLGKLALKMMKQCPSREGDCSTIGLVNTILLHWKEPLADLREPVFEAGKAGLARGDVIYGTYCISQTIGMDMVLGSNLQAIDQALASQHNAIANLGQKELMIWIRPGLQFAANLRSDSLDWLELSHMSGEFMDFDAHLMEANAVNNIIVTATTLIYKAELANTFGLNSLAAETYDDLSEMGYAIHFTYAFTIWCWGAALANYEEYMDTGDRGHLRKARKYRKQLKRRDSSGGPNENMFLEHLKVKEAALKKTTTKDAEDVLLRRFDEVIERAPGQKPPHLKGRIYRDAGTLAASLGRIEESQRYFKKAIGVFEKDWAAPAVCNWLEEQSIELNGKQEKETSNTHNPMVGNFVEFSEITST